MTADQLAVLLAAHLTGLAAITWIQDRLAQRRHDARARLDRALLDAIAAAHPAKNDR